MVGKFAYCRCFGSHLSWIFFYVNHTNRKTLCGDYLKIYELYLDCFAIFLVLRFISKTSCVFFNKMTCSWITSKMVEGFVFMWWPLDLFQTVWPVCYFDLWMDCFFGCLSSNTRLLSDKRKSSNWGKEYDYFLKGSLSSNPSGFLLSSVQLFDIICAFACPNTCLCCLWCSTAVRKLLL